MFKNMRRLLLTALVLALVAAPISTLAATSLTSPCSNLSASADGSRAMKYGYGYEASAGNGTATLTVTSALREQNGKLTLKNEGSEEAMLSFSYTVSGTYTTCTIAGVATSGTSTYRDKLAAGGSIEIYLVASSTKTAKVELKDITLEVASTAKLTVSHNEPGTVSVGGTTVVSGTTVEIPAEGTTLVATPVSGAQFLGWVNAADNSLYSTAASLTYIPTGDASLKAIFASPTTEACFWGSAKSYLFENLSGAITHATGASNKTITLAASGTLSSGDYTIPSGVALLMPFDSAGTCYTTSPGYDESNWSKPSAFSTLTMADGADITVNGAISVSAKVSAKMGYAGAPTSKYGHIAMNEGSSITVNSGANLYAWGYITGSGTVTLKSGATAYESFQVVDWRGGTASSGMLGNKNKVFPMTQYYVQNVEAQMVIESGAAVTCSMIADIISVRIVTVQFLGTKGCIFNLTSGTATKQYDGSTDRLVLGIDGALSISQTEIKLLGDVYKIKLSDYVLPINNNITVNVNSGATLTLAQDTSLLPGVQMNIAEGGTVKLNSGKRLFVYDAGEWVGKGFVYSNSNFRSVNYAPGKAYTRTNADIVDTKILVNGELDASAGYLYTTFSGANICSTANGVVKVQAAEASPTLYEATQSGTSISYESISITSAKLKNEDGSDVDTSKISAVTTYYYDHHYCCGDALHGTWAVEHTYDENGNCSCGGHAAVKIIPKSGNERFFSSLAAACKAFTTEDLYIQMLTGTTEPGFTIDQKIYLDLNGQDVEISEGKLTISDGYTLYGMDTATNGFTSNAAGQYGEIIGTVSGTVAPNYRYDRTKDVSSKCYVASTTDNKLSFHRFDMGVTDYTFYGSGNTGEMVFNMVFKGDALAKAEILKRGVEFNSFYDWSSESEDTLTGRITNITGSEFTIAYTVKAAVMLCDADNTVFTGNKYFANGISFQSAMKAVYAELTDEAKKDAFEKFATANSFSLSN